MPSVIPKRSTQTSEAVIRLLAADDRPFSRASTVALSRVIATTVSEPSPSLERSQAATRGPACASASIQSDQSSLTGDDSNLRQTDSRFEMQGARSVSQRS